MGAGPAGWGCLTSCALKAFLSVKSSSFHTTSTPSSVSMAKKVLWMPGMFPWFTCRAQGGGKLPQPCLQLPAPLGNVLHGHG